MWVRCTRELVHASPYLIATHETEEVTSAALSPDGSTLALGRQDSRMELRDVATGASAGLLGSGHSGVGECRGVLARWLHSRFGGGGRGDQAVGRVHGQRGPDHSAALSESQLAGLVA